jgi:hypothetical protein
MHRAMRPLAAACVAALLVAGAAIPTLAQQEESCGFGQGGSEQLREDKGVPKKERRPGAGEARNLPPDECNESETN